MDTIRKQSAVIWDEVIKELTVIKDAPAVWVVFALILIALTIALTGVQKNRLSKSLFTAVKQLFDFIFDTFNNIVLSCKSLFGFLDVLRLLFFGRLGDSTLYVLTNYAIIFLSVASFLTTLQGLSSLIGWIGFLVSFGIQVMELLTTLSLVVAFVPTKHNPEKKIEYAYYEPHTHLPAPYVERQSSGDNAVSKQKLPFTWGRSRRILLPIALLIAYCMSALFSYCYMFNIVVMPTISYDDYIESIDLVTRVTADYEKSLTEYRSELGEDLMLFLDDVAGASSNDESGYASLDAQIQSVETQAQQALNTVEALRSVLGAMSESDNGYSEQYALYQQAIANWNALQAQLDNLNSTKSGSGYALYQAIQLIHGFLEDPLYLTAVSPSGDIEATVSKLDEAFNNIIFIGYTPNAASLNYNIQSLRMAYNNYVLLEKYYAQHGTAGLNLSGTEEQPGVTELLNQRSTVLSAYDAKLTQDQDDASGYLNQESAKLLFAAIQAIEDVPELGVVGEIQHALLDTEAIHPQEPDSVSSIQTLNKQYRTCSGRLSLQERAWYKLGKEHHSLMAWFMLIIAFVLDGIIIILCFQRGRKYYANEVRANRQLIAFVLTRFFDEDRERKARLGAMICVIAGAVGFGVFWIIDATGWALVFLFGGVVLASLVAGIITYRSWPRGAAQPESMLEKSLSKNGRSFLEDYIKTARFVKTSTEMRLHADAAKEMAAQHQQEKNNWRQNEDYKFRMPSFQLGDYDVIITNQDVRMECYVLADDLAEKGLSFAFHLLEAHHLVYVVEIPNESRETKKAYLLPKKFMRLLYECLLLRMIPGGSEEYSMPDDMLDYERSNDDDEEE